MTGSNARMIAQLQAVAIGIQLVGLDRLPEVMTGGTVSQDGYEPKANEPSSPHPTTERDDR